MKCAFQEPAQTQAEINQNNFIMCWPEEVYEQVWTKEDLQEEVPGKRREEPHLQPGYTVLLGTLPVKKTAGPH